MNIFVENHDEGSVQCVKEMYQSNDLTAQCYLGGTCSKDRCIAVIMRCDFCEFWRFTSEHDASSMRNLDFMKLIIWGVIGVIFRASKFDSVHWSRSYPGWAALAQVKTSNLRQNQVLPLCSSGRPDEWDASLLIGETHHSLAGVWEGVRGRGNRRSHDGHYGIRHRVIIWHPASIILIWHWASLADQIA